jgi:hypothetical protein
VVTGTCAFCSVSGVSPPSEVVPKPAIVSSVVGAHSAPALSPATCVGVFVELRDSCSSVMS